MRKLLLLLALASTAAIAGGIQLDTAKRFEFTNCEAGGSAAQTLTEGTYLFRVTTEDVWICYAATCAAAGEKFGAGIAATGDAIFTGASQ